MQKKLFNRYYLCVWFGSLCLLLVHNMLNNALPLYLASIGFSTSFSGLIGVPFAILGIIGRLAGGYLADSRSRRLVMVSGTALIGVSAFLFGLAPAAALMLLLRGVQGMGFASGNAAFATASVDVTPPEKSNLGVGIFWAAMAVSVACAGYLVLGLSAGGSYAPVFTLCLVLGLVGAVLALACNYEKGRAKPAQSAPAERGVQAFLEKAALRPAVIEFLVMLGVASCNSFILMFAQQKGYSNPGAFLLIAAIAMAITNLSTDALLKRMKPQTLMTVGMILCGVCYVLMGAAPCQATYFLGGVGYGASMGFSYPVLTVMAVNGVPERRRGAATSTMLMAGDVGVGVGTFLWGAIIDGAGFTVSFLLAGISVVLGGVFSCLFYLGRKK